MFSKKSFITFIVGMVIILFFCAPINVWAQEEEDPAGDESATFSPVGPDALIVLDLSGSMNWAPPGGTMYVGTINNCLADDVAHYSTSGPSHSKACNISSGGTVPHHSNETCSGPFYTNSPTGYTTQCRRIDIAKQALFNLLNDTIEDDIANPEVINSLDSDSLDVRIGFMRFYNCQIPHGDIGGLYTADCNILVTKISKLGADDGEPYSETYCDNAASCTATSTCASNCINSTLVPVGGTSLVNSLIEAKKYLDAHKAKDKAKDCRQKFVILISDGADTFACEGSGGECQEHMYKRRRETVAATKFLADAGYRVFVIGLGEGMPAYLQNTLNWMAYYGGTNNARQTDLGSTSDYSVPQGCNDDPAIPANCCSLSVTFPFASTTPNACYPSGVTSCLTALSFIDDTTYCGTVGLPDHNFRAAANDPGYLPLSGYAFLTADLSELTTALKSALSSIRDISYSFTSASIQAVRTVDENYLYEASFTPLSYDAFWKGHLMRYSIAEDGAINSLPDWDTGNVLAATLAADRTKIFTLIGNLPTLFTTANITAAQLGVTTGDAAQIEAERLAIINLVRGGKQVSAGTWWKVGDVFHSSPVSIASPNPLFYDQWDTSTPKKAFEEFREDNQRTSELGNRIILIGANDGQLHAIKTGDNATEIPGAGGSEAWSFIPPNQLPRLKLLGESSHRYFVDGPTTAADVWLGTGTLGSTDKIQGDWRTLMVTSLGRGGVATLWSSSPSCDSGFSADYSSEFDNYCGYYAFDVTDDTLNIPTFEWRVGGKSTSLAATDGPYLGQPWSKMFVGPVRIGVEEQWVGLIGGGYSGEQCAPSSCKDSSGKGFFVVSLKDGTIKWRYTNATNSDMRSDLAARPVAVDSDNDGFLDTAYVGDLGGNVWRFKFCKKDDSSCVANSWSGSLLFENPTITIRPIYTACAVSFDPDYKLWVYFGSGDITNPTAAAAQERFYAIKDEGATYTPADLENLGTSSDGVYIDSPTSHGWYFGFPDQDKVLSAPVIYDGRVYFTTYTPSTGSDDCDRAGRSNLFILDYITAAGQWGAEAPEGARSKDVGEGIAGSPVISRNPYGGTDIYVSKSVGGTTKVEDPNLNDPRPNSSVIYWHDQRIQP